MPLGGLSVSLVKQDLHGTADQFLGRVAELLGTKGIYGDDGAGRIHHEVHGRVVLKDRLPLLLALTERLFRPLALGMSWIVPNMLRGRPLIPRQIALTVHDAQLAVWPDHAVLHRSERPPERLRRGLAPGPADPPGGSAPAFRQV